MPDTSEVKKMTDSELRKKTGEMIMALDMGKAVSYPSPCPGLTDGRIIATLTKISSAGRRELDLSWHGLYLGRIECYSPGAGIYLFTVVD